MVHLQQLTMILRPSHGTLFRTVESFLAGGGRLLACLELQSSVTVAWSLRRSLVVRTW